MEEKVSFLEYDKIISERHIEGLQISLNNDNKYFCSRGFLTEKDKYIEINDLNDEKIKIFYGVMAVIEPITINEFIYKLNEHNYRLVIISPSKVKRVITNDKKYESKKTLDLYMNKKII